MYVKLSGRKPKRYTKLNKTSQKEIDCSGQACDGEKTTEKKLIKDNKIRTTQEFVCRAHIWINEYFSKWFSVPFTSIHKAVIIVIDLHDHFSKSCTIDEIDEWNPIQDGRIHWWQKTTPTRKRKTNKSTTQIGWKRRKRDREIEKKNYWQRFMT